MKGSHIYDYWAPESSIWAPWAKPTLFANVIFSSLPGQKPSSLVVPPDVHHALTPNTAAVIDLPGGDSVRLAAALSALGFQPVPLFNATTGPLPAISLQPVIEALLLEGPRLKRAPDTAPPAFMLDSRRMAAKAPATPGAYDNRWMTFPQDFPSARVLKENNINRAVVIHRGRKDMQEDLTHVLLRWRRGGIRVYQVSVLENGRLEEAVLKQPGWFGYAFQRLLASSGLRRHSGGGFGSAVPDYSGEGGSGRYG